MLWRGSRDSGARFSGPTPTLANAAPPGYFSFFRLLRSGGSLLAFGLGRRRVFLGLALGEDLGLGRRDGGGRLRGRRDFFGHRRRHGRHGLAGVVHDPYALGWAKIADGEHVAD